MCDNRTFGGPDPLTDPLKQAERLAMYAREARFLEFALQGESAGARRVAADLERALERAMDADTPAELQQSCDAIRDVLCIAFREGLRLKAQMSDMDVDGVLGTTRMPVLTAVLSVAVPSDALVSKA